MIRQTEIAVIAAGCLLFLSACGGGETDSLSAEPGVAATAEEAATELATDVQATASDAVDSTGWTDLQSNWQDRIGSIKDQWSELTEEELLMVNGDREQLVSLVQDKYGLDRASAESEVNQWASTL